MTRIVAVRPKVESAKKKTNIKIENAVFLALTIGLLYLRRTGAWR